MSLQHPLERDFLQTVRSHALTKQGERILIALSGGADSVALLHLFRAAAPHLGLSLAAAHLDHAMRADSAADTDFVRDLCARTGIPLLCARQDVPTLARQRKLGLEEAGREARRAFLADCADRLGCERIALGHHRDDQAETVLHHLLRGCGVTGLAAMRPVVGAVIRPLLAFTRAELRDYLASSGEGFREDESNRDPAFTRNRIRHEIIPALATLNPRIDAALATLASCAAREEDYWEEEIARLVRDLGHRNGNGWSLPVPELRKLHPAQRYRLLRHLLAPLAAASAREISSRHVDAVEELLSSPIPQRERSLPGVWAARRYDTLLLQAEPPTVPSAWRTTILAPGRIPLPGLGRLAVEIDTGIDGESRDTAEFDGAAVTLPLTVRTIAPGDRIRIHGVAGRKRVKELLQEGKIPHEERGCLPVVEHAGEILWVGGVRRCDGYLPLPGTPVLRVRLERG